MSDQIIVEKRDQALTFVAKGDNQWGDSIACSNLKIKGKGDHLDFWGWKPQEKPILDDYIEIPMKSGKHFLFKVMKSKHCGDPADMFFCTGEFLGYSEDQKDFNPKYEHKIRQCDYF